ncbi:MAG: cyclase family protein [Acidobacteria bacterium]|nr:cyclase family protein [Acidobacteriota bacterium]
MRSFNRAFIFLVIAMWVPLSAPFSRGFPLEPQPQTREQVTEEDLDRWMRELSNWGRWGKEDQLGAINLITPAKRKQAAALVTEGVSISLARDPQTEKTIDNPRPYEHTMIRTGVGESGANMDTYSVSYHGLAHTHLDSLCHVFYRGKMYNGFSQEEVTEKGCGKADIHNLKEGIFTRGILIDIPRLKGLPYLEPGTPIYPEDLEAWEKKTGIQVSSGDVLFVRTGRWARRAALGPWNVAGNSAGLHPSVAKWLRERDVAMIGGDGASDLTPSGIEGVAYPLHRLALVGLGVHMFDNCDLEALSEAAVRYDRWEFLLTVAPLPVPGGTGSPVNPIATF